MRRAFREAKLDGARLGFSDCLGPCSEANVVFVYLDGRPFWLRRVNTDETFEALLAWVRDALNGGGRALPELLAARAFAWTGGGPGPEPPLPDA